MTNSADIAAKRHVGSYATLRGHADGAHQQIGMWAAKAVLLLCQPSDYIMQQTCCMMSLATL